MRLLAGLALAFTALLSSSAHAAPVPVPCLNPLWTPVSHSQGPAWKYNPDPALVLVLVGDNMSWGRGLHVVYQGNNSPLVPLLAIPPAAGPVTVQTCNALVFRATGSGENGCDGLGFDDVLSTVTVSSTSSAHSISIRAEGAVYWALPGTGTAVVDEQPPWGPPVTTTINVGPFASSSSQQVFSDSDLITHTGSPYGLITVDTQSDLPWLQLQGHGAAWPFLEVDMDHSCEAQYAPLDQPNTVYTLRVRRPIIRWPPADVAKDLAIVEDVLDGAVNDVKTSDEARSIDGK
jgi:hypothetical protein